MDAGAIGLSSGLIYAPGMHATARRGRGPGRGDGPRAAACTRPTCATSATTCSPRSTSRSPPSARPATGARLQVSHLKCGVAGRLGPGRRGRRAPGGGPRGGPRRRRRPVSRTPPPRRPSPRSCRRRCWPRRRGVRRRPGRPATSATSSERRSRAGSRAGRTSPPTRAGTASGSRSPRAIRTGPAARWPSSATNAHADPVELAFDALVDDRLDVSIVIDCMSEPDVETIMAVPWIAVCTDAEGRRPGHPILDAGRPHPRAYGSTAAGARALRPRAGDPLARDGGRQADLGAGRTARPARSRASSAKAPSPTWSCSTRRRSPTRRPTPTRRATRPASSTSSSTAGRRSSLAPRPASAPGRLLRSWPDRRSAADRMARDRDRGARRGCPAARWPYTLRRSPRSRGAARRHPSGARRRRDRPARRRGAAGRDPERHVDAFLARTRAVASPPPRPPGARPCRARRPRRPARRRDDPLSAATSTGFGSKPARPGVAALVGRADRRRRGGRDHRPARAGRPTIDGAVLEAWLKPRARAAIEREIARHAAALGVSPPRSASGTSGRAGGAPRGRAGWRSPGGSSSPRPRRSRRSSSMSSPICASSATARGSGPWSRRGGRTTRSGAAGCTTTRPNCTARSMRLDHLTSAHHPGPGGGLQFPHRTSEDGCPCWCSAPSRR